MTRGKQVQELIKLNNESAREKFEKAGFKYEEVGTIFKYVHEDGTQITFLPQSGQFAIGNRVGHEVLVDKKINRLIQKQLKELGNE